MSFWRGLFGITSPARPDEIAAFRAAISIDVSGPEFFDLYPSKADLEDGLARSGFFRPEAAAWMAAIAHETIAAAAGFRKAVETITREGVQVTAEELREMGFRSTRKLGNRFVAGLLSAAAARAAIDALEVTLHVETSRANQLHNLRRFEEAGIAHCILKSPRDERETDIEREWSGRRITIANARRLVRDHGPDIRRSAFAAGSQ